MVAELNMVCHNRLCHTRYRFEPVKHIDPIAAIRQQIKVLTVQHKLQQLGDQIKFKFKEVFSKIPHLDELPTDVYCLI